MAAAPPEVLRLRGVRPASRALPSVGAPHGALRLVGAERSADWARGEAWPHWLPARCRRDDAVPPLPGEALPWKRGLLGGVKPQGGENGKIGAENGRKWAKMGQSGRKWENPIKDVGRLA